MLQLLPFLCPLPLVLQFLLSLNHISFFEMFLQSRQTKSQIPIYHHLNNQGMVEQGVTVDIKALLYTIMVGASADFSTPIGYQTNLMVWGPGKHHNIIHFLPSLPHVMCVGNNQPMAPRLILNAMATTRWVQVFGLHTVWIAFAACSLIDQHNSYLFCICITSQSYEDLFIFSNL